MIISCTTNAARLAFLKGVIRPDHQFKVALYTDKANFDQRTKVYTPMNEVQGAGYEVKLLPQPTYGLDGNVAYLDFMDDILWVNATISAAGCMIFDASADNLAIAVVSFGTTVSSTNDDFRLSSETRLVRF